MRKARSYSNEFKVNAALRAINGGRVVEIAKELDVPASVLFKWVARLRADPSGSSVTLKPAHAIDQATRDRISAMLHARTAVAKIAKATNVTKATVYRVRADVLGRPKVLKRVANRPDSDVEVDMRALLLKLREQVYRQLQQTLADMIRQGEL